MPHTLAIITVIYKNYTILQDFFESINAQTDKNVVIYIADATPHPQPINYNGLDIKTFSVENKGYAHGINTGLKKAIYDGYTTFSIMNCDTILKNNFVKEVLRSLQEHPSSIVAGKIYYASGYEYHKTRYEDKDKGSVIWYAGGNIDQNHALTPHIGVDEVDKRQFDSFMPTSFVNGCLMCLDTKVIKTVGLWDESYFLYYEDADYCERAKIKDVPLFYNPNIVIWHKNAQSTGGPGSSLHLKYQRSSRLKFGLKYMPLRTKFHLVKNCILDFLYKR
ncbi:MAG: glycosyltransferase family 2 protein [bacterium]|nr:glycosyltransferase family 2 protein [bacterium]